MAKGNEGREFVSKLLELPESEQTSTANEHIHVLFQAAEQPGQTSNDACQKLCFFIEQCRKSNSQTLQDIAMSNKTCLDLFNFYIEWNERHQHKSMRQILELSSTLVTAQKDERLSKNLKSQILQRCLAIIAHQGPQPLVKPAFKALELYFMKKSVSPADLLDVYATRIVYNTSVHGSSDVASTLDTFVLSIFEWMTLQDVAPSAGKFLVSFFVELDTDPNIVKLDAGYSSQWKNWIHRGLEQHPESLENIQRHLFPPLFKADRTGSVAFLQQLTELKSLPLLKSGDFDAGAFLFLAAMEAGKKLGLVEEPEPVKLSKTPGKVRSHVLLPEDVIGELLVHPTGIVRTSALSVLITSSAPGRPFTTKALGILQANVGYLHADTDAKFRNEVLSSTRHLAERLRAATASLKREYQSIEFKQQANSTPFKWRKKGSDPLLTEISASLNNTSNPSQQITVALQSHLGFLSWYLDFLAGELVPTASYQRHITALRAIQLFIRSGTSFPVQEKLTKEVPNTSQIASTISPLAIFTPSIVRLLLDCLADPFEDVRNTSTEILRTSAPLTCFDEVISESSGEMSAIGTLGLLKLSKKRLQYAAEISGRADLADGVSHCHELLYQFSNSDEERANVVLEMTVDLEAKAAKAQENLSSACEAHPIHGQFASINAVWRLVLNLNSAKEVSPLEDPVWQDVQERILQCCKTIWDLVSPILCDDSPEGLELEDMDGETGTETKGVLSYGWRAVHESSRLTSTMAQGLKLRLQKPNTTFLSREMFTTIGELSFTQLQTLRHRGAFSTVFSTFSSVCVLTQIKFDSMESLGPLLEDWYERAQKTLFLVKSTTRRSAGLPMLFNSIMAAVCTSPKFDEIMRKLFQLAAAPIISEKDETNLYQVHALNCLKETFKSSVLGRKSEPYISDGITLAESCLKTPTWAIKNCGLLLFRSLIDRLFGTSESKAVTEDGWNGQSVRLDYSKYPRVPKVLLDMLAVEKGDDYRPSMEIGAIQSVFPALDIIRRAGPPDGLMETFEKAIRVHLSSPSWHVRDIAARTLATMVSRDSWSSSLINTYLKRTPKGNNMKHGHLAVVNYVLQRQMVAKGDISARHHELREFVNFAHRFGALDLWTDSPSYVLAEREFVYVSIITGMTNNEIDGSNESPETLNPNPTELEFLSRDRNKLLRKMTFKNVIHKSAAYQRALAVVRYHMKNRDTTELSRRTEAIQELGSLLESMDPEDVGFALLFLEGINSSLMGDQIHQDDANQMVKIFKKAFLRFEDPRVRAECLKSISQSLEYLLYEYNDFSSAISEHELPISTSIQTPDLLNAIIRFQGSAILQEVIQHVQVTGNNVLSPKLKIMVMLFGGTMKENGTSNEDFDSREAVVKALKAFLGHPMMSTIIQANQGKDENCFLPALLAVFDALVDDDDEIRDDAAKAAVIMTRRLMIPLEAATFMADALVRAENCSMGISQNMILRLTGSGTGTSDNDPIISFERQLVLALREDTALFVEEEQNLFVDEVREMNRIVFAIVDKLITSGDELYKCWIGALTDGYNWTLEGLKILSTQMRLDGPFGWTSRPAAYALCLRITSMCFLVTYAFTSWQHMHDFKPNSVLAHKYAGMVTDLRHAMLQLRSEGKRKNLHPRIMELLDVAYESDGTLATCRLRAFLRV